MTESHKSRVFWCWTYLIVLATVLLIGLAQSISSHALVPMAVTLTAALSIGWVGVVLYLAGK